MLSSGSDHLVDSSGASSSELVPTMFVWPYGGRNVYLIGSFTGWSDHLPMSPREGCTTTFQVVCRLAPGIHEYKFYVDGEWRHDEQKPYVTESYGIVNTVNVTRQLDISLLAMTPDTPNSRMNMDVDQEVCQRGEMGFGISVPEIDRSRSHIAEFLSVHTAYELLPISGKVVVLDVDMPVKQAFHIQYEQGLPVAPLLDSNTGEFVGVLSPVDFILILKELNNHGSIFTEEELESHQISSWKLAKQEVSRQLILHGRQCSRQLIHAGPFDSLKDIAIRILQNQVSTIPIIHQSSEEVSYPQLLHLATLSGILKCIWRYFRNSSISLPILQQPICSIPLGTWASKTGESNPRPLEMLRPNASLGSALSLLVQAQVSSIPIVDGNDSLIDIYSRSDITSLAKDEAYTRIRLDDISIHQALQLRQEASLPNEPSSGERCQMCLRSDTLQKVIERLSIPGVRRLIIIEAGSKRVEGIISLTDVFRYLLGA